LVNAFIGASNSPSTETAVEIVSSEVTELAMIELS